MFGKIFQTQELKNYGVLKFLFVIECYLQIRSKLEKNVIVFLNKCVSPIRGVDIIFSHD
jgi:hypothetical protein